MNVSRAGQATTKSDFLEELYVLEGVLHKLSSSAFKLC